MDLLFLNLTWIFALLVQCHKISENTESLSHSPVIFDVKRDHVVEHIYQINYDKVATPIISFEGAEEEPIDGIFYLKEVELKLKSYTEDAQIQYKLSEDAETWEHYDPGTTLLIVGPSNPDLKIFFQATKDKMLPSDVVSKHFLYKEVL